MIRPMERYDAPEFRGEAVVCSVPGCHTATRHGKPWCLIHIGYSPLAAKIIDEINGRERDLNAAISGVVRADNYLLNEALRALRGHPSRTVEGLAKELHVPPLAVRHIYQFLFRKGLAIKGTTRRGGLTATLVTNRQKVKMG